MFTLNSSTHRQMARPVLADTLQLRQFLSNGAEPSDCSFMETPPTLITDDQCAWVIDPSAPAHGVRNHLVSLGLERAHSLLGGAGEDDGTPTQLSCYVLDDLIVIGRLNADGSAIIPVSQQGMTLPARSALRVGRVIASM